jgi:BirA family biotin operon repressor/biotin-[acetyl-CoA-carboxylase] ligase
MRTPRWNFCRHYGILFLLVFLMSKPLLFSVKRVVIAVSVKKYVLELLENKRGQNISGAHIAEQLNVTRNSVWKAVKELEKAGYRINAVTNKGYCLCDDNDILSVQGMLPFLSDRAVSNKIKIYDSLESTNKTAKELAISGAEHGTIVISDCQTVGKGRYNRNFFSMSGHGIYMSFILRPNQRHWIDVPTLVTSYAAVSVCRAIEKTTGKTPQIKWVNDIFIDGKKVCGILTEGVTDLESGNMQWIVVGIGINFISPDTGFPEDIKHIAGSVFSEDKPTITRNRLAAEVINLILDIENSSDSKTMLIEYKKRLMMIGKKIVVSRLNEPSFEAVAIDIDEEGRLIIRKGDGDVISLFSGEISIAVS